MFRFPDPYQKHWPLSVEDPPSEDYAREKRESDLVDGLLGFRVAEVEARVRGARTEGSQLWDHLPSDVFQTPYAELLRILRALGVNGGDHVVDLGAAYGRMAFVVEAFFASVKFTGYEISGERVEEAARVFELQGLKHSRVVAQDLESLGFVLPAVSHYFIYDFGTRRAIEKTLLDLKRIAGTRSIRVAARGRASRDAIERGHPWLSQVHEPRHFSHYSIYRS